MLIGRDRELRHLVGELAARRPVAVRGPAGIGKSALLREGAVATGRRVFAGGGIAQLMWEPYLPLLRALGVQMRGADPVAVAQFVATVVGDGVLVLDDLQCADAHTLALLPALVSEVALLCALRDGEPLSADAREACAQAGLAVRALGPLAPQDAAVLVEGANARLDARAVARVVAAAAGNPLFLEQLALEGQPTETLTRAIDARLAARTQEARLALATIALRGRSCELAALGEAPVAELADAGLVDVEAGRVAVRQRLVGERAVNALDADMRKRVHARLAAALTDPGERARHEAAAGLRAQARASALAAAATAGPFARSRHLALAAACSDGPEKWDLHVRAALAMLAAGEPSKACALAEPVPLDADAGPLAALVHGRARIALGEDEDAVRVLSAALPRAAGTGATELTLKIELLRAGGGPVGRERLAEARALAAEARATRVEPARALLMLGTVALHARDPSWRATLEEAIDAARAEDDFEVELLAGQTLMIAGLALGEDAPIMAARVEALEQRARGLLLRGWELQFTTGRLWLELTSHARCEAVELESRELLDRPVSAAQRDQLEALLGLAIADSGRPDDALERVDRVSSRRGHSHPLLAWVGAEAAWLARRPDADARARNCLREHAAEQPVGALAAVTAAWAADDADGAAPDADGVEIGYGGCERERDAVARLRTDPSAAVVTFYAAATRWSGLALRGELRSRWGAAEALRRAGDPAARDELRSLDGDASATELGGVVRRIRKSRRDLGDRIAPPRPSGHGDPLLSPRENEILTLAASGLTIDQIAARLDIKSATVKTHFDHAKEKLGVANRSQAVAEFTNR